MKIGLKYLLPFIPFMCIQVKILFLLHLLLSVHFASYKEPSHPLGKKKNNQHLAAEHDRVYLSTMSTQH